MQGSSVRPADAIQRIGGATVAILLLAVWGVPPADAQEATDLKRIEKELKSKKARKSALDRESRSLAADISELQQRSIKAARAAQASEAKLTEYEERIAFLAKQQKAHETSLRLGQHHIAKTMTVLTRMARNPPRALLFSPDRPVEVVRRAMLLRAALPAIQRRADKLRTRIAALTDTRKAIEGQRKALKRAQRAYELQKGQLRALLDKKDRLFRQTISEQRRVAERIGILTQEAKDLRELFAKLEAEREAAQSKDSKERDKAVTHAPESVFPKPAMLRAFPESGTITMPANGQILRRYGENTGFGNTSKGITLKTRRSAQVVAPYDGKIVFSGPFRGYGEILIIEHDGGYHSLLAGLEQIEGRVGQWVLAGEPIGTMGKATESATELYFELRRRGHSINPLPWLASYWKNKRG